MERGMVLRKEDGGPSQQQPSLSIATTPIILLTPDLWKVQAMDEERPSISLTTTEEL
jgi:hypothetical protein